MRSACTLPLTCLYPAFTLPAHRSFSPACAIPSSSRAVSYQRKPGAVSNVPAAHPSASRAGGADAAGEAAGSTSCPRASLRSFPRSRLRGRCQPQAALCTGRIPRR